MNQEKPSELQQMMHAGADSPDGLKLGNQDACKVVPHAFRCDPPVLFGCYIRDPDGYIIQVGRSGNLV